MIDFPHNSAKFLQKKTFLILFSLFVAIRLLAAFCLPVLDTTEARYAEIARKMLESGNWVTLFHDYGVPFWGKPPLSTWLSAMGMGIFGVNAFAARLPIFLLAMATLWLIANLARTRFQEELSRISSLILLTGVLFYVASAAVMTDMALAFGLTLSMVAFWHVIGQERPSSWRYLFFIGQSIGLLSKGLISLPLAGFPILIWGLSKIGFKELWRKLPWISGTILLLVIVVPWHVLAELKTPGFLNYYFIGEHLNRFLVKGWSGDLYGYAHQQPKGLIWIFWLMCAFPWSLWLIGLVVVHFRHWRTIFTKDDGWVSYLVLWAFCPLLFFTFSQNVIWTYPLPGIPAFALLVGHFLVPIVEKSRRMRQIFLVSCCLVPTLMILVITYLQFVPEAFDKFTQKNLVETFIEKRSSENSKLVYNNIRFFSAEFYSRGLATVVHGAPDLRKMFANNQELFIGMPSSEFDVLPQDLSKKLLKINQYGKIILFKKINEPMGK